MPDHQLPTLAERDALWRDPTHRRAQSLLWGFLGAVVIFVVGLAVFAAWTAPR